MNEDVWILLKMGMFQCHIDFQGGYCVCGPLSVTVVGLTVIGMPDPDNVT